MGRLRVSVYTLTLLLCAATLTLGLLCYQREGISLAASAQGWVQHWPFAPREIQVKFEGPLEEQAGEAWRIAGQQVHTAAASFLGAPSDAFVVGAQVRVQAIRKGDGSLEARSIAFIASPAIAEEATSQARNTMTQPQAGDGASLEFEGEIAQLPAGDSWIGDWLVADVRVRVDEATKISGTPRPGANVEIVGLEEGPRALRALDILVQDSAGQEVVLRGIIVERSSPAGRTKPAASAPDAWMFVLQDTGKEGLTYQIWTDQQTFIDESRGQVTPNSWVEIRATRQEDGSFLARYIRLIRP